MAKLFACKTFRDVTAMAQQVFGGVGFTLEYDIQLYFRRAKQLQISWWDDRYLEELDRRRRPRLTPPAPCTHSTGSARGRTSGSVNGGSAGGSVSWRAGRSA